MKALISVTYTGGDTPGLGEVVIQLPFSVEGYGVDASDDSPRVWQGLSIEGQEDGCVIRKPHDHHELRDVARLIGPTLHGHLLELISTARVRMRMHQRTAVAKTTIVVSEADVAHIRATLSR